MVGIARRKRPTRTLVRAVAENDESTSKRFFEERRNALLRLIEAINDVLDTAHPDDREGLRRQRQELEGKLARLAQEHEAVFVTKTLAINAPSQAMIDKTKSLASDMDKLIRAQKRAEAIVALLAQMADLAEEVGITP